SSVIVNTILCVIFIKAGASIQIVKLTTSAVYLLRPLLYRIYVKRKYDINRKIEYVGEPIKQKWNGMAQHIAAVVLTGTDTIVLTIFSTLKNVSIYNIYYLVIAAIRSLFQSLQNGIAPLLGNLWAKGEEKKVADFFAIYEWITHATTVLIFGITSSLIVPFVMIYTRGINDANYNQPLFASLLVLAYAIYSLRNPYNIMVQVAGKYRETQVAYILAAVINIVTSVAAVFALGLIGVAIGTIVSLAFQTCWMGIYVYKNLIPKDHSIIKIYVLDILISGVSIGCIKMISLEIETIAQWFIAALVYSFIWGAFSAIIWGIFERKKLQAGIRILFKKQKKA
ncbi:MAG: polysaccharide biosynthesis C-terminal domain-containing protein, partial [Lachnospiraceae bacterium]|nr:polysaccharide biosynthesis C-terminal domain-containing protein [Lachnospiraceae bacterium]